MQSKEMCLLLVTDDSIWSKKSYNAVVLKTELAKLTKMKSDAALKKIENMSSLTVSATQMRYANSEMSDRADFEKQLKCCWINKEYESVSFCLKYKMAKFFRIVWNSFMFSKFIHQQYRWICFMLIFVSVYFQQPFTNCIEVCLWF